MRFIPVFTLLIALLSIPLSSTFATDKESAYDRVMESGKIRCGYVTWDSVIEKDPNTGEFSGITYEIMEEAGKLLSVDVEWVEELGWANTVEALNSGRIDAVCTGYWRNPQEGKFVNFTIPLFYSAVGVYVRKDDERFDNDLQQINNTDITISSSDGMMSGIIANQEFPDAKVLSHPNLTDLSVNLMDVVTKKADVTFSNTTVGNEFIANNPGTLKNIAVKQPIRVFGNTIALPQDDHRIKIMIDSALIQLRDSGYIDRIIDRYEKHKGSFYRVSKPYEVPQ